MLATRATTLFGIEHPVVLGGMGSGNSPELVAAVSNAGGLGVLGVSMFEPSAIARLAREIRARTEAPFGLNLLLFRASREQIAAVLDARPHVFSTSWPRPDQDLAALFASAHAKGLLVMHMVSTFPEAEQATTAGADVIVAQGTEGGGHVGVMATSVLARMVARRIDRPLLAAGGFADGAGLASALALGADGILLGTRFLATPESSLPEPFKRALTESDGHDTLVTDIPDIAAGNVWPGAYARVQRNRFVEEWLGREGELRRHRAEVYERVKAAREQGDTARAILYAGQTAGLIDAIEPAGDVVRRIASDAEEIIRDRLTAMASGSRR